MFLRASLIAVVGMVSLTLTTGFSSAQDINFTEGSADITWFYDSTNDSWDVVFRNKGGTVATGLTSQYDGPPGGFGGGDDWNFDTLNVHVTNPLVKTLNGNQYYTAGAQVTPPGRPDLGIRIRLRELDGDGNAVDQFSDFRLELDWAASTKPMDAQFAMFNNEGDLIRYETADDILSSDWPISGHSHWNWAFSHLGDYNLVFNFQGIGGAYGPSSSGTVNVGFSVVPEPSSVLMLMGTGIVLFGRRRRFATAV